MNLYVTMDHITYPTNFQTFAKRKKLRLDILVLTIRLVTDCLKGLIRQ